MAQEINKQENIVKQLEIETHPFEPFIPDNAKVLIMGTFPPGNHRWSMNFYYPNRTNDFWYMMGLIFYGDKNALTVDKNFNLEKIKSTLTKYHIAMNDTAYQARRLMGNASDKFLEIVTPVDLYGLLTKMPLCKTIATTGEKAADVIASITSTQRPMMGKMVQSDDGLNIWRMPSTSRAYPLKLEKKAEFYSEMFHAAGIL